MRSNNTKITLALFGALVAIMITFPVVYGYLVCPSDKKFLGITGLYPIEQFYYLSIGPSQAAKGHVLFTDKYGRLPDEDVLLNPIANIIGIISAFSGTSLPIAFNIFRVFSSLLLVISFYYLSRQFIASRQTLLISIIIYCFSGGFDFWFNLLHLSSIDAVDDSFPEANIFIAICGEYYLPVANALFITALASAYGLFYRKENKLLLCGISLFLLGAVYVYGLVTAGAILTVGAFCSGYSQKRLGTNIIKLLKLAIFCLPVAAYYVWLIVYRFPSIDDEGWFSFPGLLSFVSTYGFAFLFTVIGFLIKDRLEIIREGYLLMWIIITLVLIYLPQAILPIQIQMLIGLSAPLSIMFATSLAKLGKFISVKVLAKNKQLASILISGISCIVILISSATNIKFYINQYATLDRHEIPSYLKSKVYDAIKWSSVNMDQRNLVIISNKLGFIFSAMTSSKVYMSIVPLHQETAEKQAIERALILVLKSRLEEAKNEFQKTDADYLFLDKLLVSKNFEQMRKSLKECYSETFANEEVSIYKLK